MKIKNSKYFIEDDVLYQITKRGIKRRDPTHIRNGIAGYQLFINGKTNWYSIEDLKGLE